MSSEISGYIQIVIGLTGIIITLVNVQRLIPDINLFTNAKGAPPELHNFSSFMRVLIVVILLLLMLFLLGMGFAVTLSTVYRSLGAQYPLLSASMTILTLTSLAVTLAMALYRYRFWVAGFVGSAGGFVLATVAALNDDLANFWGTVAAVLFFFAITGFGTLITYAE
jgi:type III secretory pathway component EscU